MLSATYATEDLMDPEVNADPFGYYGWLRESDPVHWNPLFEFWIVSRHSDVVWLLRNQDLFSSKIPWPSKDPREVYPPIDEADWPLAETLRPYRPFIVHDRPEHLAMRQSIHRWFTPRGVEKWRAQLAARTQELIDFHRDAGMMEVKRDLPTPLPLMTICWMLGVPSADAEHLYDLASVVYAGGTENQGLGPPRLRIGHAAAVELQEYFTPLIEERMRAPREDLISMMADGEHRGVFTRQECIASLMIFLDAGHSTTLSMISKGTLAFIRHPEQWELLRSDPEGLGASATEECLRYDPPLKMVPSRIATRDVEFGGKQIRAGANVAYAIAAANRDPRAFADPDSFDITRSPNPHVAFAGGIHHCIGSALARIEGQEAFKALARNFPQLRLEREVAYVPNPVQHMLTELHVCWD